MKDGLHLIGGMGGAILALALYIIGWGTLQKCFGVEVQSIAPDGVNIITKEVDENGYVMGEKSTAVYVAPKYIPQSGEWVVIGDQSFVVVAKNDWTRWTNAVARLESVAERRWTKEHQTEEGRRAWHGPVTNRVYSADGLMVTWLYRDGYEYVQKAQPKPKTTLAQKAAKNGPGRPRRESPYSRLPKRLRETREAIDARPAAREVNVTFGPGGKVLKVEDGK